ncbi:MAG: hypothetical protein ACOYM3_27250 [Terrimicrobiaceae bacterium]
MRWMEQFQQALRRFLRGGEDERLRKLEDRQDQIAEGQRKHRGKLRQMALAVRRDRCVKWIHAAAAMATVLIGLVTAVIGWYGRERAIQEIELTREKAFYRPGIAFQETNRWMEFVFMNPGERTFQDFRAVWEVAHIPSKQDINRGMSFRTNQVWGVINGRESLSVALPIPPTTDNLYAMAVCSGVSVFNKETRTNWAVSVRYRYGGRWFDYRGGATTLGDHDRATVEQELERMREINRTQTAGEYSENWK